MHLKVIQHRRKEGVYEVGMTCVTRVAHFFPMCDDV